MKKSLICAALILSGCNQVDQLKDMRDTTNDLDARTTNLGARTDALYENLRQGNSVQTREQALATMDASNSQEEKILYAGIYMMGFEFQLWTAKAPDDAARRLSLFNDMFIQLDKDIRNYVKTDKISIDPTSTNNNRMNLYALSATMHMINPMQQTLVDNNPGMQAYSVLSLTEQALQDNRRINDGTLKISDLPTWENQALQSDSDLLAMIQLRANFIPALVLSEFTGVEYAGLFTKFKDLSTYFTADFDHIGLVELSTLSDYMNEANANRDFLESIGSNANYNCRLNLLYKNMKLPSLAQESTTRAEVSSKVVGQLSQFEAKLPSTSLLSCVL